MKVATLAGCADNGTDDGARGAARFDNPVNLVLSPSGIAYVADFDSRRLRKVEPSGRTTTLVELPHPFGMAIAPDGYLIVGTAEMPHQVTNAFEHVPDTRGLYIKPEESYSYAVL